MIGLKEFTVSTARPLPVILMADVSGSMAADGKIDALNAAVAEMQAAFAEEEDDGRAEIHLAVVTFGGTAALHTPLTPASEAKWTPMSASGRTPMGAALDLVTATAAGRPLYTPGYGAPEVVRGTGVQNTLGDARAFAVLAFETLALVHPLLGDAVQDGEPEMEERAFAGCLPCIDMDMAIRGASASWLVHAGSRDRLHRVVRFDLRQGVA